MKIPQTVRDFWKDLTHRWFGKTCVAGWLVIGVGIFFIPHKYVWVIPWCNALQIVLLFADVYTILLRRLAEIRRAAKNVHDFKMEVDAAYEDLKTLARKMGFPDPDAIRKHTVN